MRVNNIIIGLLFTRDLWEFMSYIKLREPKLNNNILSKRT